MRRRGAAHRHGSNTAGVIRARAALPSMERSRGSGSLICAISSAMTRRSSRSISPRQGLPWLACRTCELAGRSSEASRKRSVSYTKAWSPISNCFAPWTTRTMLDSTRQARGLVSFSRRKKVRLGIGVAQSSLPTVHRPMTSASRACMAPSASVSRPIWSRVGMEVFRHFIRDS
jgi:hypothetical protein